MRYTNDAADKATRRLHYYRDAWAIPAVLGILWCGGVWWANERGLLAEWEWTMGGLMCIILVLLTSAELGSRWLKMPDGSFYRLQGADRARRHAKRMNEPARYTAEYRNGIRSYGKTLAWGVFMIVLGSLMLVWIKSGGYLIAAFSFLIGLWLTYDGAQGLAMRSPLLKVAGSGIWTRKLGFVHWDDIGTARVAREPTRYQTLLYLEIFLKGTPYEAANRPDQRLPLNDLEHGEDVEAAINASMRAYRSKAGKCP